MTDTTTNKRLTVSGIGEEWSSIMLPESMVDKVRLLLDANKVRYWVDEAPITFMDEPPFTVINLGRGTDGAMVQRLLDGIP